MDAIARVQLRRVADQISTTHNMKLDVSNAAYDAIADIGFDPRYGARPLKRAVQNHVLHPLSILLLEGACREGEVIRVRASSERNDTEEEWRFGAKGSESSAEKGVVILRNRAVD